VSKELKLLHEIQKILKENGYFDTSRISQEILEHSEKSSISPTLILERVKEGEPWEYIRGEVEFCGNKFIINKSTLIPRIETEQIVDIAIDFLEKNPSYKSVLDIGTGSGCIIISIAKNLCEKKNIIFLATDIKGETLEVAKRNAVLHKVNKKVAFLKKNLLNNIKIKEDSLIIANLPYIPEEMYKKLDISVIDFEPKHALIGGKDGLKYYRNLVKQILKKKPEDTRVSLLIEIEPSTLKDFKKLIDESKYDIRVFKDYRDLKRFVLVKFS
jgi:release factor glutamine methyltransferase